VLSAMYPEAGIVDVIQPETVVADPPWQLVQFFPSNGDPE
jgi:hypothetical protein